MSWQQEIAELVAYGRRIGLDFESAWDQAVECVDVPPMYATARGTTIVTQGARGQMVLEVEGGESVLLFFKGVCRRSWEGEEIAPPGCFEIPLDSGGVSGIGKARSRSKG